MTSYMTDFRPRWSETKLTADTKPKIRYEYWVTGRGEFPIDMLRHDCAWPADNGELINRYHYENDIEKRRQPRAIKMRSHQKPEVDRWRSFGWTVSEHDLGL